MEQVTMRDLRNRGGEVLEPVTRGEILTVTRDGHPVAVLRPLRGGPCRRRCFYVGGGDFPPWIRRS